MSSTPPNPATISVPLAPSASALARFFDGDVWHSFKQSPMAIAAAVMAAYLCLIALVFVTINLAVDLLYFAVDPRLRIERSAAGH